MPVRISTVHWNVKKTISRQFFESTEKSLKFPFLSRFFWHKMKLHRALEACRMNFAAKQIFHLPVNKILYSLMKTELGTYLKPGLKSSLSLRLWIGPWTGPWTGVWHGAEPEARAGLRGLGWGHAQLCMKTHNFFQEHEMPPQQRVEKAVGTFDENLCWLSSGQRSKKIRKNVHKHVIRASPLS